MTLPSRSSRNNTSRQPRCAPGRVIALRLVQHMHSRRPGRRPEIDSMTIASRSRRGQQLQVLGHADERTLHMRAFMHNHAYSLMARSTLSEIARSLFYRSGRKSDRRWVRLFQSEPPGPWYLGSQASLTFSGVPCQPGSRAPPDRTDVTWSGGPGESHPRAPTDPCVTVSRYTALAVLVIWRPV